MKTDILGSPTKCLLLIAALLVLSACGQSMSTPLGTATQVAAQAGDTIVGMRVDDFQLVDQKGFAHQLYYYKDATAIVLMTQGNGCPIVRNAMPVFRAVRDAYADRGVEFFLLNSNLQDNQQSIAAEAEEFGFDMRVLVDEYQLVGESLKVTRTAEVFVIDPASMKVVYHGPVDDRLTYQVQKADAQHEYLVDALDALIEGRSISVTNVDAPGCLINFPERDKREKHASISYHDTIAPLLEKRCVSCHTEGGIGPWAMSSYEMVRGFAPMIREEMLLSLPRYDFNWQRSYEFVEPVDVPAGSKLIARYTYDNSSRNLANPDPEKEITWGDQSYEEMLFTALSYRWKEETRSNRKDDYDELLNAGRGFGMLDDNIDNRLEKHELKGRPGRRIAANFDRMDTDGDGVLTWDEYSATAVASNQRR